jgi:hypothetical protein
MAELWTSTDPRPIAIVEPHYDDAWLNLGGAMLLHPQVRFRIVSIAEDEKNCANETQHLGTLLSNVETVALRLQGIPWSFQGTADEAIGAFCLVNRLNSLAELGRCVDALVADCREMILPLGLEHPQHGIVSRLPCSSVAHVSFYREFPYFFSSPIRNWRRCIDAIKGKQAHVRSLWTKIWNLNARRIDIRPSLDEKVRIFAEVYRSQSLQLGMRRGAVSLQSLRDEMMFCPVPRVGLDTVVRSIRLLGDACLTGEGVSWGVWRKANG